MTRITRATFISTLLATVAAVTASAATPPFPSGVPNGFTQELYATSSGGYGGIAFAPNGDVWMTECKFNNGALHRFQASSTITVNGTKIHPEIAVVPSNTGCGLVNHPNGKMYSVTTDGITELDPNTGAVLRTLGEPGFLSLVVDPVSKRLIYNHVFACPGTGACLYSVDPVTGDNRPFASFSAEQVTGIDGIAFDPAGQRLYFSAALGYETRLGVVRRTSATTGVLERFLGEGRGLDPDGVVVHALTGQIYSSDTDGKITRWNPDNNTQTTFASGGFRGDLANVGNDGCAYVSQNATRFLDGTETQNSSIVRICSGFDAPSGEISGLLNPAAFTEPIYFPSIVIATLRGVNGEPLTNRPVTFTIESGPNAGHIETHRTDLFGNAAMFYSSRSAGTDTVIASFEGPGNNTLHTNEAHITWTLSNR